jgi:hypothetical protein
MGLWTLAGSPTYPLDVQVGVAIADGHGGEHYFRSDRGSKLAAQVALAELRRVASVVTGEEISPHTAMTNLAEDLPRRIVDLWRSAVDEDLECDPPGAMHKGLISSSPESGGSIPHTTSPIEARLPYGTTLLATLIVGGIGMFLQLGDGDLVLTNEAGVSKRVFPSGEAGLGEATFSMCGGDAIERLHTAIIDLVSSGIALVSISSDGYSKSFTSDQGFLKVGPDILERVRTHGAQAVIDELPSWLDYATANGSGDDITVGLIVRESEDGSKQADPTRSGVTPPT